MEKYVLQSSATSSQLINSISRVISPSRYEHWTTIQSNKSANHAQFFSTYSSSNMDNCCYRIAYTEGGGRPLRPKARGLVQHGGRPGRLVEWPSRVWFCTSALTDHTTCPGLGLIYFWMYTKHPHELCHASKAWPDTLADPCLLSGAAHVPQNIHVRLGKMTKIDYIQNK